MSQKLYCSLIVSEGLTNLTNSIDKSMKVNYLWLSEF